MKYNSKFGVGKIFLKKLILLLGKDFINIY